MTPASEIPSCGVMLLVTAPAMNCWTSPGEASARARGCADKLARELDGLEFIDLFPHFLTKDGQPRTELFLEDGTHLSPQGYVLVASLVRDKL